MTNTPIIDTFMKSESPIASQIHFIQNQLQTLTTDDHSPIQLVAVTKSVPATKIHTAYLAGQMHFGENYLQEALSKITDPCLQNLPGICWHFIGPIQRNKTKLIAEHFSWVQSVDRTIIAQRLNEQRPSHLPKLNVLIQINISQEPNKQGIQPDAMMQLAQFISVQPKLVLRGLMAVPQAIISPQEVDKTQSAFAQMKDLFSQLQANYESVDTLSMGMSDDYKLAVAHGSNMIRLGTAIFGKRTV